MLINGVTEKKAACPYVDVFFCRRQVKEHGGVVSVCRLDLCGSYLKFASISQLHSWYIFKSLISS